MKIDKDKLEPNIYNIKPSDFNGNIVVANRSRVNKDEGFYRVESLKCWIIHGTSGTSFDFDEFFIRVPDYKDEIEIDFSAFSGMTGYNFTEFYKESEIKTQYDLSIQIKFMKVINDLFNYGIIKFKET